MKVSGKVRTLVLIEDKPITPNALGGICAALYSQLELLANSGREINLLILSDPLSPGGFQEYTQSQPETWKKVRSWCASDQIIYLTRIRRGRAPLKHLRLAVADPAAYLYSTVNERTVAELKEAIARVRPQLILAYLRGPALLARRATSDIPVVYGHYDWEWRLFSLRHPEKQHLWRIKLNRWLVKRVEENLVRRVAGCISGSASEAAEISSLGSKVVEYFPTAYVPSHTADVSAPLPPPRIVHLGGLHVDANRIGLKRFVQVVWPSLDRGGNPVPEFWVIGSKKNAHESFLTQLSEVGAVCTGFVENLDGVLRPYDIHVIPWEYSTGTRTRVPLALNHLQVIVSTRAAVSCFPELEDGENCVLVDDLEQMAREILALIPDEERRKRIGRAGRYTFMKHFTREALQPRFDRFMNLFVPN